MLQTKGLAFRLGARPELVVAFGRQSILTLCLLLTVLEGGLLSAHSSAPGASKPKTMEAFATYVQATNARNDSELQNGRDLLWVDTLPQPGRDQAGAHGHEQGEHGEMGGGEPTAHGGDYIEAGRPRR